MDDPWKHRSAGMKCKTCMWYAPKKVNVTKPAMVGHDHKETTESVDGPIGRCRRHAPTMNGYPAVFPEDWCGDHKVNEETIGKK